MSAARAAAELRKLRPTGAVALERRRLAMELIADVRRLDNKLVELRTRIVAAVGASGTCVVDVYGVGPIVAAHLVGYTGDVAVRYADTWRRAS